MSNFQLSQREALAWAGDHEWKKGQSYVRDLTGLTAQPDGEKWVLQASAHGQEKYAVRVTLQDQKIQQARCSCPVGGGGYCKHVAALLARAVKSPDDFAELSDLADVLDKMDAKDLRRLVRLMLEREPDLTRLVLTRPGKGKGGKHRNDLRQRIEDAVSLVDYDPEQDWEGEGLDLSDFTPLIEELQGQLEQLAELELQAQGDLLAACLALLDGAQQLQDDDYGVETDELFAPARTGLLKLLQLPLDENLREMALEGLQDSIGELGWPRYEIDREKQAELFASLPDEERHLILDMVRDLLKKARESYAKKHLAALLYALNAEENLSLEEELELAKASDNQIDLVNVLFKHERIDEAIKAATAAKLAPQEVENYFAERNLLSRLEEYAQQNLKVYGSRAWLFQRYQSTGRQAEAYALAWDAVFKGTGEHLYYTSFFLSNDLDWLQQLKATSPDWPADREQYIQKQWKRPEATDHLMRFLLEEGLLERAEELVAFRGKGNSAQVSAHFIVQLALRLSAERAKPLFMKAAALYVAGGDRQYYKLAAETLSEAIAVIGKDEAKAIAALLLRENPRLRALPDELNKAGLV